MSAITLCSAILWLLFLFAAPVLAQDNTPDFVSIQAFARLANASYQDAAAIKKELESQRYSLDKLFSIPGYEVSGFVGSDAKTKTQVIVVRGTANLENALVDVELKLLPDKKTGVKLHQGFSQSAGAAYQQILPALHKGYHMVVVGHSLGGAVAVILAMYLDVDKFNIEKVVTFGQPKVTNVAGARKYADLNIIRVVNPKDVVPLVPPLDPMDLMKLDIYWHMGKEIVLLDNHEYAVLEGVKSMMRISRFTNVVPDESNLTHHMMAEYLQRIAGEIPKAKQVPYETGFGLFGGS